MHRLSEFRFILQTLLFHTISFVLFVEFKLAIISLQQWRHIQRQVGDTIFSLQIF